MKICPVGAMLFHVGRQTDLRKLMWLKPAEKLVMSCVCRRVERQWNINDMNENVKLSLCNG
jgi:hypothetical protein